MSEGPADDAVQGANRDANAAVQEPPEQAKGEQQAEGRWHGFPGNYRHGLETAPERYGLALVALTGKLERAYTLGKEQRRALERYVTATRGEITPRDAYAIEGVVLFGLVVRVAQRELCRDPGPDATDRLLWRLTAALDKRNGLLAQLGVFGDGPAPAPSDPLAGLADRIAGDGAAHKVIEALERG